MEITIEKTISILHNTPATLQALLQNLETEQINTNEGPQTWNVKEILAHLIVCETTDWLTRIELIISEEKDKIFTPINMQAHFALAEHHTLEQLLQQFTTKRKQNLHTLQLLHIQNIDLQRCGIHPVLGPVTIEQLLAAWMVHDYSHTTQMLRVMAKLYQQEVGPFNSLLGVLKN